MRNYGKQCLGQLDGSPLLGDDILKLADGQDEEGKAEAE